MIIFLLLIFLGINDGFGSLETMHDFGTYGHTTEIDEEDLIEQLQKKLATVDVESLQESLRQKILQWVPKPALERNQEGEWCPTQGCRVHFYDPTFTVSFDIKDHKGRVMHKKGTQINPLHYRAFKQKWIFMEGIKSFPEGFYLKGFDKVILVNGNPFELMQKYNCPFYFDQGGVLVKKFGIQRVPAVMQQEGEFIKIQEGSC